MHVCVCRLTSITGAICIPSLVQLRLFDQWFSNVLLIISIFTIKWYNTIRRPEEALDIQFVNGMVHLPHEWNFGTPITLPSLATTLSPLTATPETIFPLMWRHTFNLPTYKIIAWRFCANRNAGYNAGEGVPCYSWLINIHTMVAHKCTPLRNILRIQSDSDIERPQ